MEAVEDAVSGWGWARDADGATDFAVGEGGIGDVGGCWGERRPRLEVEGLLEGDGEVLGVEWGELVREAEGGGVGVGFEAR